MSKNFSRAVVAAPPTPADTGTSLTVQSGQGAALYDGKAIVAPAGLEALTTNAEVVDITVSGDTVTLVRAREGSTARAIVAGDKLYQGVTAAMWDTLVSDVAGKAPASHGHAKSDVTGLVADLDAIAASLASTVATTDPRLSDARTPTAHAASHAAAGSDALTLAQSQVTGLVSDLAGKAAASHAHAAADITSGTLPLARGGTGGTDAASARTALGLGTAALLPDSAVAPAMPSMHGFKAWNVDPALCSASGGHAGGLHVISRLRLARSESISNIHVYLTSGGTSMTGAYGALYAADGTLIAQSSDQSSTWGSAGLKSFPLTGGPYTLPAGDYYATYWAQGAALPSLVRVSGSAALSVNLSAPNLRFATAGTGLGTTAPSTLGTQTAGNGYWMALS